MSQDSITFILFMIILIYVAGGFAITMCYADKTNNKFPIIKPIINTIGDLILFIVFMPSILTWLVILNIILCISFVVIVPFMLLFLGLALIYDSIQDYIFSRHEFVGIRKFRKWLNKRS